MKFSVTFAIRSGAILILGCGLPLFAPRPPTPEVLPPPPAGLEDIQAVEFTRDPCMAGCPAYQMHLRRDNTASYLGYSDNRFQDEYRATLESGAFDSLAARLVDWQVFTLPSYYPAITDSRSTELAIEYQLDSLYTKRVIDLGTESMAFARAVAMLESIAERLPWEHIGRVKQHRGGEGSR